MLTDTRTNIRALVSRRTRIVDRGNAHPAAALNIDLDDAYREARDIAAETGWDAYLTTTGQLAMPTTAATNETFVTVPVPTNARFLKRLETRFSTGTTEWRAAEEVPLAQLRRDVPGFNFTQSGFGGCSGFRWCLLDSGLEATEAVDTGSAAAGLVAISPVPTGGYYQLWYCPEFPGTSADSGAGGFYTYVNDMMRQLHVYLASEKILISDNDSNGMLAGIAAKRKEYEAKLRGSRPVRAGPRTWRRSRQYNS